MTKRLLMGASAAALLSACAPAPPPEPPLVLVHGPAEAFGTTPAWCYSTLADPDCYTQRVPGAGDRLIGAYVPVGPDGEPGAESE